MELQFHPGPGYFVQIHKTAYLDSLRFVKLKELHTLINKIRISSAYFVLHFITNSILGYYL
jgi:hypothetical protein